MKISGIWLSGVLSFLSRVCSPLNLKLFRIESWPKVVCFLLFFNTVIQCDVTSPLMKYMEQQEFSLDGSSLQMFVALSIFPGFSLFQKKNFATLIVETPPLYKAPQLPSCVPQPEVPESPLHTFPPPAHPHHHHLSPRIWTLLQRQCLRPQGHQGHLKPRLLQVTFKSLSFITKPQFILERSQYPQSDIGPDFLN